MAHQLPNLTYAFDALEPYIDATTMQIHHDKHHAAYLTNLNKAIEGSEYESMPVEELLRNIDSVHENIRTTVRNNGGGFLNHNLFWQIMAPNAGGQPSGELLQAMNRHFKSFDDWKQQLTTAAMTRFGSGWAWLVGKPDGSLAVYSTPNQDSPLMQGDVPVLGLDVWEHAYYLKYQNRRNEYVANFFNVINWQAVADNHARLRR
jgi:superoxide dismutase, Fe-Mn family